MEEIPLGARIELARPLALDQHFQKEGKEIEILFRRRERKRVDLEILGLKADANIRAAEELREALKASAQIEDEGMRVVFLEIGDEEIQKETLAGARSSENHGV